MSKRICVVAGRTAGSCARAAIELGRKTDRVSKAIKKCAESTGVAISKTRARLSNLCRNVVADSQLAFWEKNYRILCEKLGEKVFRVTRKGRGGALKQKETKYLLSQLQECWSHIDEIRKEKESRSPQKESKKRKAPRSKKRSKSRHSRIKRRRSRR